MKITDTPIDGLKILEADLFEDSRGSFMKIFHKTFFKKCGLEFVVKESYFTKSDKNVIRGMHFQIPPHVHSKIVTVLHGKIVDVVLDIRKGSPTYGNSFSITLSHNSGKSLIIPKGLAHGFESLEDNSIVSYMQTTEYAPEHDRGIKYDSFGFSWRSTEAIVSPRDLTFEELKNFDTPFFMEEIQ